MRLCDTELNKRDESNKIHVCVKKKIKKLEVKISMSVYVYKFSEHIGCYYIEYSVLRVEVEDI